MSQAEDKLREVLTSIAEDKYKNANISIKPVSSNGANYSSILYEATIFTPEEVVEIFAKVMAMGANLNAVSRFNFNTERYSYITLLQAYKKLKDKYGLGDEWFIFPKHYKSNEIDGIYIVALENLALRGYGCYDRLESIDWQYASECVKTLARYHALSLAFSAECPEEFAKAEEVLEQPVFAELEWEGLADAALAVVDEEDRRKLLRLLEGSKGWSKMRDLCRPRKAKVIIHSDYRASNLMHKEVGGEIHVIPVDYQTIRVGCPAADLIYFIVTGSDQQFRRQHFQDLVDHYYHQLALAMKCLGLEPDEVYGREEFDSDMKEKLPHGLCVAAMVLPYVTIDVANAPSFEDGRYVPRATSELFAERFRELMEDFSQWGFV